MRSFDCSPERLRGRLANREWRLIEDETASGAWNMALDDALLEAARRDEAPPTLRLYGWARRTLSLGHHQDPRAGIDHDFRRRRGIDMVRRPTGGRAVLHDREVTYSLVLPRSLGRGAGVGEVYRVLTGALLAGVSQAFRRSGVQAFGTDERAFRRSGIQAFHDDEGRPPAGAAGPQRLNARTPERLNAERLNAASCFATAAGGDGLAGEGKLVGSAQARRAGAVLQHGSVLLEVRRADWLGLFGSTGLAVALDELIGAAPAEAAVRAALREGMERELGATLVPGAVAPAEWSLAERLVAERYGVGCLD